MASVFRRKISHQVLTALKKYVNGNEWVDIYRRLPLSLKLSKSNSNHHSQYLLSWKQLLNLKPDLQNHLHPETVLTYLTVNQIATDSFTSRIKMDYGSATWQLIKKLVRAKRKLDHFHAQEYPVSGCISDIELKNDPVPTYAFSIDNQVFNQGVVSEVCSGIDDLPVHSSFFLNLPKTNVIVEYSSPNIAKPFHYGHFRSTVLGNFIGNIHQFVGHNVTRINYLGDWGLQYGILATGFQEFGSEEKLKEDPLQHLYEVYKEANAKNEEDLEFNARAKNHFKKMEEGDQNALLEWKRLRDLSITAMNTTYERLGVKFDEVHSESTYADKSKVILKELTKKGIAQTHDDGLLTVAVDNGNSVEDVVLQKSDGTSLYLSRDVAAAIARKDTYNFDTMYYVVDSSQSKHFRNLIEILKYMGYYWSSDVHHVPFGRIVKFSTRKGTAVFLHDILDEAQERTTERMKNSPNTKVEGNFEGVADILGISSLIINDMGFARKRDYEFDWDRVLNMEGNSGVSLQYCHARLTGIKENCGIDVDIRADLSFLTEPEAYNLIHHIAKFDEAVYKAYMTLDPYILVHYLFRLKSAVGKANKTLTVKDQNIHVAKARLLLFHAAQKVLCKGLQILGITPLDHM